MKLIINCSELEHISEKSTYNHNYYKVIDQFCNKTEILEICHEDEGFSEFYLIENEAKIFLGYSDDYISTNSIVNIDFRKYYT